jgi:transcriptional regulator with XRE-family HTH domain
MLGFMPASDSERSSIGKRIATLRRRRGLTQRELAHAVGVTDRAVQAWEQGRSHPYRHLKELEEALGDRLRSRTEELFFQEILTPTFEDSIESTSKRPRDRDLTRLAELEARLREVEERLAKLEKRGRARKKQT